MLLTRLTAWEEEVEADGLLERRRRRSTRVLQHFRAFRTSGDQCRYISLFLNPGEFLLVWSPSACRNQWNGTRPVKRRLRLSRREIKCESRRSGSAAQVQLSRRQMPGVDSVGVSRRRLIYRRFQVFSHFCGSCVKMSKAAEKFCSLRRPEKAALEMWEVGGAGLD